ncbi:MAG: hypothetical protein KF906_03165 [Actinobacteria bacterium]|nr:hypothetical protein [Actinomycetota bacterium]
MSPSPKDARVWAAGTIAVVGLVLFVGFRTAPNGADRSGLERYRPEAIAAIGGELPSANAEVIVVMEARNICQQVARFATGSRSADEARAAIDGSVVAADEASADLGQTIDVSEFANFATSRIDATSVDDPSPASGFVSSECPADIGTSAPVIAE